ncbi:MAG: hypothetical protein GX437_04695 [Sphingobacteriales bacterium]|nr:hypothetical protein [Sphingobacteriales bacterium]
MNETELRDILIKKLKGIVKQPFLIDTEVPVPYKHIYIPTDDKTKLELWCFKQDITIYKILFDKTVKQKDSKITKDGDTLIDIVLEKDSGQNSHHAGLPFVILELKKGQPNTHEILTYSQKAEMIKTIFPYCQFLFLILGNVSARTYRHGINFDTVISLQDVNNDEEIKNLKKTLLKHFKIATTRLKQLTENNYKKKSKK